MSTRAHRNGRANLLAGAAAIAVLLTLAIGGTALGYTPAPQPTWVVSGGTHQGGVVASVAVSGSTAYIGGNFDWVGPETGSFVAADTSSSALASPWPTVGGNVYAAASDGSGGFFIGGLFSSIGTRHADNIAHIKSDGTLDTSWTGSTDGTVYSIAVSGTNVYAGGAFATAGGAAHANLAAFSKANGAIVPAFGVNAAGTNAFVAALRLSGTTLYVGGRFTTLGLSNRVNIGSIDVSGNGATTTWIANANDVVYALAVSGSVVYAGGNFTTVNTTAATPPTRNHVAAFSTTTGTATAWNPNASDGAVYALDVAPANAAVYAGGGFSTIGGATRHGLAKLNTSGGAAESTWDPNVGGQVFQVTLSGSIVYAGGKFTTVNGSPGVPRENVAAFATDTAAATDFHTVVGGEVDALALSGTNVGLGGEFRTAGGGAGPTPAPVPRANVAAIDLTSGQATTWNPTTNDTVEVLMVSGSTVYAGGDFTTVGATNIVRHRLAAFNDTTGAELAWNPGVHNGAVVALEIVGNVVYVGGTFSGATAVSSPAVARNRAAAFDAAGVGNGFGDLKAWDPNANNGVFALDAVGSTIYMGGSFTSIRTSTRNRLAAVTSDPNGFTSPLPWDPNANNAVFTLAHAGSLEYAGGPFTGVNNPSLPRGGGAAFSQSTGVATSWNPQAVLDATTPGTIYTLAPSASSMYVGGDFRTVGGPWTSGSCSTPCFPSPGLAAVSLTTGAPNGTWAPGADDLVSSIALAPQGLVAGGQFSVMGFPPPGTQPVNPDEPGATYRGGFGLVRALPDAPASVTAVPGDHEATVSFQPSPYLGGESSAVYSVLVSPGGTVLTDVTSPVTIPGLSNGTAYTFFVSATTPVGTGEPGASTATPRTTPGAPTGVTAVPGNLQATVSFTPPADTGGETPSQYTVKASTGQTAIGGASPIVITGLTNDAPVTFTVIAQNSAGPGPESAPSDPVIPIEPGRPHPTPPILGRPPVPDLPAVLPPRIPPPGH